MFRLSQFRFDLNRTAFVLAAVFYAAANAAGQPPELGDAPQPTVARKLVVEVESPELPPAPLECPLPPEHHPWARLPRGPGGPSAQ